MSIRERIETSFWLTSGFVVGAGVMYILDPEEGSQRRSLALDKLVRLGHYLGNRVDKRSRDLGNRIRGQVLEMHSAVRDQSTADISDSVLCERVRAQLGHVVSHPSSLQVRASDGAVTVSGRW